MANVNATSAAGPRVALLMQQEAIDIAALPADTAAFKNSELPLARIKKIMKLDDDVRGMMIAAEAPLLFSKAADLLIKELTLRAWMHTERQRRRTLQRTDISASVYDQDTDQFDFLIDIVPREEPQHLSATPTAAGSGATPSRSASAPAASSTNAGTPAAAPATSLTAELMEQQAPAVTVVTSSQQQQQQQQQVQYVIHMAGGQQQQLAFVSSQDQPAMQQQQQPMLHFATASGSDGQQEMLDVKPDIAQMGLSAAPVPISFAGL